MVGEDGKVISSNVIDEKKDEPKKKEPKKEETGKGGAIKLEDCPKVVQDLFKREAGEGGKILDLEKGEREGKVVYAATLVCKEKSYRIVVTAEGKVVSCKEIDRKQPLRAGRLPGAPALPWHDEGRPLGEP